MADPNPFARFVDAPTDENPFARFIRTPGAPVGLRERMTTQMGRRADPVDVGANLFQGLTLGAGDEMRAGMGALMGENYDEKLQEIRAAQKRYEQENPNAAMAGKVAGAAFTINPIAAGVRAAPTLLGRMGQGAGLGAGVGAVEGFAGGEGGLENRATDATVHGLVGGAAGGALQPIGEGLQAAGRWARNILTPPPATERAKALAARSLERDRLTPQEVQTRLGADPTADLVDVTGENTKRLARSVASQPGQAANTQRDFVTERGARSYVDVNNRVLQAFNPEDYVTKLGRSQAQLKTDAEAAYGAAYAQTPFVRTPEIEAILATPAGQAAVKRVSERVMPGQPSRISGIDPKTGQAGYDLQALREIKSDLYAAARGQNPVSGGNTDEAAYLKRLSGMLNDELKKASPAFKSAAEQYADDAGRIEALQLGREKFLTMDPTELKLWKKQATPAERELFMTGAYGALENGVMGGLNTRNLAHTIVNTPRIAERIRAVLSPNEWMQLRAGLQANADRFATTQMIGARSGSQTQLRAADAADAAMGDIAQAGLNVVQGQSIPRAALGYLGKQATRVGNRAQGLDEESAALLSDLLLRRPTSPEYGVAQQALFGGPPAPPRRLINPLAMFPPYR